METSLTTPTKRGMSEEEGVETMEEESNHPGRNVHTKKKTKCGGASAKKRVSSAMMEGAQSAQ